MQSARDQAHSNEITEPTALNALIGGDAALGVH